MATAERAGSGRRGARRTYWRRQIEAHRRSGLSQVAFCAQRGLRTGTLSFWKWKFGQEARPAPHRAAIGTARATAVRPFIPIRVTGPQAGGTADGVSGMPDGVEIEITLGPGRGLRVQGRVGPAWLVQVLRGIAAC